MGPPNRPDDDYLVIFAYCLVDACISVMVPEDCHCLHYDDEVDSLDNVHEDHGA